MKKLSILLSLATMIGFTACEDKKEPVYVPPTDATSFVLYTPVLQNEYFELTAENTLELVCAAQPDYGYSAIAKYSVEVSLTEDFQSINPEDELIPAFVEVPSAGTGTQSRMVIKGSEIAMALCQLRGYTGEDNYQDDPATKVYFRAVCQLEGVEGSRVVSNVVYLSQVKGYFAVPVPGYIYLVGQPSGWVEPADSNKKAYEDWRLSEADDAIGSKIYRGTFNVNAGEATLRFYSALTGWDGGDSWGYQADDSATEFEWADGFTTTIAKGKGSYSFPNWPGGKMAMLVDLNAGTVVFSAVAE